MIFTKEIIKNTVGHLKKGTNMGDATIPLSKGYNPKRLQFPVYISEKYDGMPVRIDTYIKNNKHNTTHMTRQGTVNVSVDKDVIDFVNEASQFLQQSKLHSFVAEVTHETITGFKNISGTIRRREHNDGFIWNFFDYILDTEDTYRTRRVQLADLFAVANFPHKFRLIKQHLCENQNDVDQFLTNNPIRDNQEGWVIRSSNDLWKPGSRSWGYQKIVVTPSEDLPLVQVDEAISKDGEPLGMAGKLWVEYKNDMIGCGPGALNHQERKDLWKFWNDNIGNWKNPIIEVKYKKDDTYTALREARFVSFRPDKD